MSNRILVIIAATLISAFVSIQCCIYTAIIAFMLLSTAGMSPMYCWGAVDGCDHYHSWVRVGSHNIEQSTLNIYHSDAVDYNNPEVTFNTTTDFIDGMNMWSPIKL